MTSAALQLLFFSPKQLFFCLVGVVSFVCHSSFYTFLLEGG